MMLPFYPNSSESASSTGSENYYRIMREVYDMSYSVTTNRFVLIHLLIIEGATKLGRNEIKNYKCETDQPKFARNNLSPEKSGDQEIFAMTGMIDKNKQDKNKKIEKESANEEVLILRNENIQIFNQEIESVSEIDVSDETEKKMDITSCIEIEKGFQMDSSLLSSKTDVITANIILEENWFKYIQEDNVEKVFLYLKSLIDIPVAKFRTDELQSVDVHKNEFCFIFSEQFCTLDGLTYINGSVIDSFMFINKNKWNAMNVQFFPTTLTINF